MGNVNTKPSLLINLKLHFLQLQPSPQGKHVVNGISGAATFTQASCFDLQTKYLLIELINI